MKTLKQKQLGVRKKHSLSFRRYVSFEGSGDSIKEYLDLNAWEIREYIESLWEMGMDWENYKKDWVIDHIVPLRCFDIRSNSQMKLCWNHLNFAPKFISDNHEKGASIYNTLLELMELPQTPVVKLLIEHSQKRTFFSIY